MGTSSTALFQLREAASGESGISPSLAINERVKQLWRSGHTVYHLGFGESRFPVHPKLRAALSEASVETSYLDPQGHPPLLDNIARFYSKRLGASISAEQIIAGPGSKPLLFAVQLALNADLLLPSPSWVSYGPQANLLGRAVHWIHSSPGDDYRLTIDNVDRAARQSDNPRKLLLINSPNCPTGRILDAAFLSDLADYCRQNRIAVMSDEIYGLIPHGDRRHVSISTFYPEGTIIFGGVSKHLSLGGWRLGFAIAPPTEEGKRLIEALRRVASEIWSSPSTPVQYALSLAFSEDPDIVRYIAECASIHSIRTRHIHDCLRGLGVRCAEPEGGFYLFPNFDKWRNQLAARGVFTSSGLAGYLLDRYDLATLPGAALGRPDRELSLRLATSYLDMETPGQAETVLSAYRINPDPKAFMKNCHPNTQQALRRFTSFVGEMSREDGRP